MEPPPPQLPLSLSSSSTACPIASTSNRNRKIRRRKQKIIAQQTPSSSSSNISWKSETTQQLYSAKLLAALRHVHQNPTPPSATPRRSRAVREAADKALAIAAKGRTRWSRAILHSRLKLKFLDRKHKRQKVVGPGGPSTLQSTKILRLKKTSKDLPGVERKVKTLGWLVPGCRKETLPIILEEATDYIPALEMQIRAMRDLLSRFSALTGGGGGDGGNASSSSDSNSNPVMENGTFK